MLRIYLMGAAAAALVVAGFAAYGSAQHHAAEQYQLGYTAGTNAAKVAVQAAQATAQAQEDAARTAADVKVAALSDRAAELQKELDDAIADAANPQVSPLVPGTPAPAAAVRTVVVHDPLCLDAGSVRGLRGIGARRGKRPEGKGTGSVARSVR